MTFSIVGQMDDAFGVAVASKFIAVGSVVPEARTGLGAVATQALARLAYRDEALAEVARRGPDADATVILAELTAADEDRAQRQVGLVTPSSQATFTGEACHGWAGGVCGRDESGGYAIQGNILVGEQVVLEAQRAWLGSAHLTLPQRLMSALLAGDRAGGDRRGRQAAALYVVQPGAGYDHGGVLADLRVDDNPAAATELARLLDLNELYFGRPSNVLPLVGPLAQEVRERLAALDHHDDELQVALAEWAGEANFEMRLTPKGIDARVLQALREVTA